MKKVTNLKSRTTSLITGSDKMESLYTFKNFPVFMGCTDDSQEADLFSDMEWEICKETGIIQLKNLLPLETLYLNQHNDGTGKIWEEHYKAFANFLLKYNPKNILEIGGAHDKIAKNFFAQNENVNWTIVEPNPEYIENPKIKVIRDWFDNTFQSEDHFDTIIHSHVFEHTYDPVAFIEHISKFMKVGDRHIFTFPNLLPMLENKWTNCLNFEHTAFLTEEITDYILQKSGFKIIEKEYYGNPHSIFYSTEKVAVAPEVQLINNYEKYKSIFLEFINFHSSLINELNKKINESTGPVYLFGAHIFSQYLMAFGLKSEKIVSILDNSPIKQGKRLYGSRLLVESPLVLKDKEDVNVILKVASYREEISKQLLEINPQVKIW